MIYVKHKLFVIFLLGLLWGCLGQTTGLLPSVPDCVSRAPGVTFEPSSSCVLDVTTIGTATRHLQLLGAGGPRTPTVFVKGATSAGLQGAHWSEWLLL